MRIHNVVAFIAASAVVAASCDSPTTPKVNPDTTIVCPGDPRCEPPPPPPPPADTTDTITIIVGTLDNLPFSGRVVARWNAGADSVVSTLNGSGGYGNSVILVPDALPGIVMEVIWDQNGGADRYLPFYKEMVREEFWHRTIQWVAAPRRFKDGREIPYVDLTTEVSGDGASPYISIVERLNGRWGLDYTWSQIDRPIVVAIDAFNSVSYTDTDVVKLWHGIEVVNKAFGYEKFVPGQMGSQDISVRFKHLTGIDGRAGGRMVTLDLNAIGGPDGQLVFHEFMHSMDVMHGCTEAWQSAMCLDPDKRTREFTDQDRRMDAEMVEVLHGVDRKVRAMSIGPDLPYGLAESINGLLKEKGRDPVTPRPPDRRFLIPAP